MIRRDYHKIFYDEESCRSKMSSSRLIRRQLQTCLVRRKTFGRVSTGINTCTNKSFCTSSDGKPKMSFQDTLNKMKREAEVSSIATPVTDVDTKVNTDGENVEPQVVKEGDNNQKDADKVNVEGVEAADNVDKEAPPSSFNWSSFASKISEMSRSSVTSITDMFKDKPKSALDYEVEKSYLRRKIHQALTFTQTSEARSDSEDGYDGPREMVWIKDPLSPWESMKARMAQSPLIKDLLKRTFKVTQAASETKAGKKLGVAGQAVQDKLDVSLHVWFFSCVLSIRILFAKLYEGAVFLHFVLCFI